METLYANWFCGKNLSEARAQMLPKRGDGLEMDWSQLRLGYRMGMCSILALWVCWDCIWGLVRNGNSTIGARAAFPVFRGLFGLLLLEWFWGCRYVSLYTVVISTQIDSCIRCFFAVCSFGPGTE